MLDEDMLNVLRPVEQVERLLASQRHRYRDCVPEVTLERDKRSQRVANQSGPIPQSAQARGARWGGCGADMASYKRLTACRVRQC